VSSVCGIMSVVSKGVGADVSEVIKLINENGGVEGVNWMIWIVVTAHENGEEDIRDDRDEED